MFVKICIENVDHLVGFLEYILTNMDDVSRYWMKMVV